MDITYALAQIYGLAFIVIGFSVLQKRFINDVIAAIAGNAAVLWLGGFFAFILGLISLELYSTWSADWRVALTIIGWLSLLKGLTLLFFPRGTLKTYRALGSSMTMVTGIIALVVGLWLAYVGFGF